MITAAPDDTCLTSVRSAMLCWEKKKNNYIYSVLSRELQTLPLALITGIKSLKTEKKTYTSTSVV